MQDGSLNGNSALYYGGGIYAGSGTSSEYTTGDFINVVFENNTSSYWGGGIMITEGVYTWTNSSFLFNQATDRGGAIFAGDTYDDNNQRSAPVLTLNDTLVQNSTAQFEERLICALKRP